MTSKERDARVSYLVEKFTCEQLMTMHDREMRLRALLAIGTLICISPVAFMFATRVSAWCTTTGLNLVTRPAMRDLLIDFAAALLLLLVTLVWLVRSRERQRDIALAVPLRRERDYIILDSGNILKTLH